MLWERHSYWVSISGKEKKLEGNQYFYSWHPFVIGTMRRSWLIFWHKKIMCIPTIDYCWKFRIIKIQIELPKMSKEATFGNIHNLVYNSRIFFHNLRYYAYQDWITIHHTMCVETWYWVSISQLKIKIGEIIAWNVKYNLSL